MARRKRETNPLLDAMDLYLTLDERDRNTFINWIGRASPVPIRAETAPKSTAPSAGKRSKQKSGETGSTASTATEKEDAGTVTLPLCATCGLAKAADVHDPTIVDNADYHIFRAEIKKRGAGA